MVALRQQKLDPRQPVGLMAEVQAKRIHGEIVGLSGGLGEIRSRGVGVLECMWIEVEAVPKCSSGLQVTSISPEGESDAGLARAMGDEEPQRVRHSWNLVAA